MSEEHDTNKSGADPNRPGWHRVMAEVRGRHVQLVAATKVDRVMRSMIHFYDVVQEFDRLGADLVFVD